jgi:hypothetical protein
MPRYSEFDRETALCEFSRKCLNPAEKSSGGPCAEHAEAFAARKAVRNAKARDRAKTVTVDGYRIAKSELADMADMLGLNIVKSASGKIYLE